MIPVGLIGEHTLTVTDEIAINFLGVAGGRVLATPALIMNLEIAARNAVKPYLGDEHDSVGTEVWREAPGGDADGHERDLSRGGNRGGGAACTVSRHRVRCEGQGVRGDA